MLDEILEGLEHEITTVNVTVNEYLPNDVWLLASMLQKSIRRGEIKHALNAAASLLHYDKKRFWYRLHIIAVEDVGATAPDIISKVLATTASPAWRKKVGDIAVGLYLTKLLCKSVKTRLAESIYTQLERSVKYERLRLMLASCPDDILTEYVIDANKCLIKRCMALRLLAGTKKYPSPFMPHREGSMDKTIFALRCINAHEDLKASCISAINLSPWPLAIFTPLIWQELQKNELKPHVNKIPESTAINGLPLYTADMFTRVGKACIRELKLRAPDLKLYSAQQLGLGIFYLESRKLNKTISALALDELTVAGEMADIESAGLALSDYEIMKACLLKNMDKFTVIRQALLRQHLVGVQNKPTITHYTEE